jgi:hypothetical protein
MILNKINPIRVFKDLRENIDDLLKYQKYKKIIYELNNSGKLEQVGFSVDEDANLYIGINLNPELLLYSETSMESVELRLVSEKVKKYTEFLTNEGILDSIKMDYDRVKEENYYGYILQISYAFKKYKKKNMIYDISYFSIISLLFIIALLVIIF